MQMEPLCYLLQERSKQGEPGDELKIIHHPTNNSFTLKKVS